MFLSSKTFVDQLKLINKPKHINNCVERLLTESEGKYSKIYKKLIFNCFNKQPQNGFMKTLSNPKPFIDFDQTHTKENLILCLPMVVTYILLYLSIKIIIIKIIIKLRAKYAIW